MLWRASRHLDGAVTVALTGYRAQASVPGSEFTGKINAPVFPQPGFSILKASTAKPLSAMRASPLRGRLRVPGDKSISHRALIFGALATGTTRIRGLLEAEDVINTGRAVAALGALVEKRGDVWEVKGRGPGGLRQPAGPLDFGNSGTGTRLMMGVVAGHPITVEMTGDASLSRRPMRRVLAPLMQMGLQVVETGKETLPRTLRGTSELVPIVYPLPVPSAQVKTAVLLAGLHAAGETTVIEHEATRDHTERMLRHFGADVRVVEKDGTRHITVRGDAELQGRDILVPGDPSSAAFLVAAALIVPDSDVTIEGVLVNPTRTGLYTTLQEMGGDVVFLNEREDGGEPIADIRVRASSLKGIRVPAERAPSMIDEYPVLAAISAFARGTTRMDGLAELKVKESDRLQATATGLTENGVRAHVEGDSLIVEGEGRIIGGGQVATHLDHRIAMAFLTAGLASDQPIVVDDTSMIATSFPEFRDIMEALGAGFDEPAER
jgi:3-phosphoshikimate 1-carboxyvinyltransferase